MISKGKSVTFTATEIIGLSATAIALALGLRMFSWLIGFVVSTGVDAVLLFVALILGAWLRGSGLFDETNEEIIEGDGEYKRNSMVK